MNEAFIFTARNNATTISNYAILATLDRINLGAEKKNNNNSQKMKEIVAVHEARHAIVAAYKKIMIKYREFQLLPEVMLVD